MAGIGSSRVNAELFPQNSVLKAYLCHAAPKFSLILLGLVYGIYFFIS